LSEQANFISLLKTGFLTLFGQLGEFGLMNLIVQPL
jgi:hypothetical protein